MLSFAFDDYLESVFPKGVDTCAPCKNVRYKGNTVRLIWLTGVEKAFLRTLFSTRYLGADETMSGIASVLICCVSKHTPWLMPIQVAPVLSEEHLRDLLCSLCKRWRCFVTCKFTWQNQISFPLLLLLVPISSLHSTPLPLACATSDQQAGLCFALKSRVTSRPTLGQGLV